MRRRGLDDTIRRAMKVVERRPPTIHLLQKSFALPARQPKRRGEYEPSPTFGSLHGPGARHDEVGPSGLPQCSRFSIYLEFA